MKTPSTKLTSGSWKEGSEGPFPASCVACRAEAGWSAVLIRGASGAGKSSLALRLIALGGRLVADDQVLLRRDESGTRLLASAPPRLAGLIEARGVGLMRLPALAQAPVFFVLDLVETAPQQRLPPRRSVSLLGIETPLLQLRDNDRAASTLCCLLQGGALLDPEADLADVFGAAATRSGDDLAQV